MLFDGRRARELLGGGRQRWERLGRSSEKGRDGPKGKYLRKKKIQ